MRIDTRELGIELTREGRAYLEYALFGALHRCASQVDRVHVSLRRRAPETAVTCVMAADLRPAGRAVVALRAEHPYAAIDRAAARLRHEIEQDRALTGSSG